MNPLRQPEAEPISVAAVTRRASERGRDPNALSIARRAALGFVFLWFLVGGIAHFIATDVATRIVPPFVPWPRAAVLVSGVFELLGAAGLVYGPTRRVAGIGLFVLTLAVTPANIYMLQRHELFPVPVWLLVARLPLQVGLLWLIWWSAAARNPSGTGGNR